MTLDYFYGAQADQFAFYRIPKALFTDERFKSISAEAKILYGILLDGGQIVVHYVIAREAVLGDDALHCFIGSIVGKIEIYYIIVLKCFPHLGCM